MSAAFDDEDTRMGAPTQTSTTVEWSTQPNTLSQISDDTVMLTSQDEAPTFVGASEIYRERSFLQQSAENIALVEATLCDTFKRMDGFAEELEKIQGGAKYPGTSLQAKQRLFKLEEEITICNERVEDMEMELLHQYRDFFFNAMRTMKIEYPSSGWQKSVQYNTQEKKQ